MSGYPNLVNIRDWFRWRDPVTAATEDALLTDFAPSKYSSDGIIRVAENTALAVVVFGQNANNLTAELQFTGWMDSEDRQRSEHSGTGPGFTLWQGTVSTSSVNFGASEQPIITRDGTWAAAQWRFTKSWTASTNMAAAVEMKNGSKQSILLLPTLGFYAIRCMINLSGQAAPMTTCGVLARWISKESVI